MRRIAPSRDTAIAESPSPTPATDAASWAGQNCAAALMVTFQPAKVNGKRSNGEWIGFVDGDRLCLALGSRRLTAES